MKNRDLNGPWKLTWCEYGASIENVLKDNFVPSGWIDTIVPEDVRTALRRRGIISGYYYGKNLDEERWIDNCDWIYHKRFYVPENSQKGQTFIQFDGIDTLAEIWLNGKLLGISDNMFRCLRFDTEDLLRFGKTNILVVRIRSPVKSTSEKDRSGLYPADDTTRLLLRKSQMNHGWDFCGHCLSVGIWRSVSMIHRGDCTLEKIKLRTASISDNEAKLAIQVYLEPMPGEKSAEERLEWTMSCGDQTVTYKVPADGREYEVMLPHPRLWWPKPYGAANLYQVSAKLLRSDVVLDESSFKFGVRTVQLIQDKLPGGGRSFILAINGRAIFVRGANWVPLNCLYAEISNADYDKVFRYVLDSNLSMLRVWGGGIYEPDYFFDLCDQHGIMVFQDFMLACGIFPQDEPFLKGVHDEAAEIIERYYNHPSLVLWSADNECDEAYSWYGLNGHFKENRINREAVAQAVREHDPYRPFLVSSPASPFESEDGGDTPNSPLQGDMHIYLPRFTREDTYYYKKILDFVPRFMSEYGFSSLPNKDTFDKFNFFRTSLDMKRDPCFDHHKVLASLDTAGDTEKAIYLTQFAHAQALKYWIEYLRSHKWICGGSLYWKFNDPLAPNRPNMFFPTLMSSLDFYYQPKLSYYYARRAYEDCILAFRENRDGTLQIWGCNETSVPDQGNLTIQFLDFKGTVPEVLNLQALIPADGVKCMFTFDQNMLASRPPGDWYIKAVFCGDHFSLVNRFFPGSIGDWIGKSIPPGRVDILDCRIQDGKILLGIRAHGYVQDIQFSILDVAALYSDNGFCMENEEEREVAVYLPQNADIRNKCLLVEGGNAMPLTIDLNEMLLGT
jgi:beta-mannosidase